jgi:uncharacterized protein (DUF1778 family)
MKKHGNTGKQNALQGESVKESYITVRVEPEQKAIFVKAAKGKKLSVWVIESLKSSAKSSLSCEELK